MGPATLSLLEKPLEQTFFLLEEQQHELNTLGHVPQQSTASNSS
jgi:hypothetical protein